jgi:hypothetical protein
MEVDNERFDALVPLFSDMALVDHEVVEEEKPVFAMVAAVVPEVEQVPMDEAAPAPAPAPAPECVVCMCEPASAEPLCAACRAPVCADCVEQFLKREAPVAAMYGAPVRCFNCHVAVPFAAWRAFAHAEAEAFRDKVLNNLAARCPYCDTVSSVVDQEEAKADPGEMLGKEAMVVLRAVAEGSVPVDAVAMDLMAAFVEADKGSSESVEDHTWVWSRESVLWRALNFVAAKAPDAAVTLALRVFKAAPAFQTGCCDAPLCWKCMVQDQHLGQPCADMTQDFDESTDLRSCPGCDAMLLRSEGCDSVTCVMCRTAFCWVCGMDCRGDH